MNEVAHPNRHTGVPVRHYAGLARSEGATATEAADAAADAEITLRYLASIRQAFIRPRAEMLTHLRDLEHQLNRLDHEVVWKSLGEVRDIITGVEGLLND